MSVYKCKRKPEKCPICHSDRIADVIYGYMDEPGDLKKDEEEGKIIFAGCVWSDDDPDWQCVVCGTGFINDAPPVDTGDLKFITWEEFERMQKDKDQSS